MYSRVEVVQTVYEEEKKIFMEYFRETKTSLPHEVMICSLDSFCERLRNWWGRSCATLSSHFPSEVQACEKEKNTLRLEIEPEGRSERKGKKRKERKDTASRFLPVRSICIPQPTTRTRYRRDCRSSLSTVPRLAVLADHRL
jgi:hypothetical protein